jgi:hypothetical protein
VAERFAEQLAEASLGVARRASDWEISNSSGNRRNTQPIKAAANSPRATPGKAQGQ